MKEGPILMKDFGVQRILAKAKTQTRRIVRRNKNGILLPYPYEVGDHLWVREAWRIESFLEGEPMLFGYRADGSVVEENYADYTDDSRYETWWERVAVQSTDELIEMDWPRKDADGVFHWDHECSPLRWRTSIFMPRWASRITLEITGVKREPIQAISYRNIIAEGIDRRLVCHCLLFRELRDSINLKRGYSWVKNPLVDCVSFEVLNAIGGVTCARNQRTSASY